MLRWPGGRIGRASACENFNAREHVSPGPRGPPPLSARMGVHSLFRFPAPSNFGGLPTGRFLGPIYMCT